MCMTMHKSNLQIPMEEGILKGIIIYKDFCFLWRDTVYSGRATSAELQCVMSQMSNIRNHLQTMGTSDPQICTHLHKTVSWMEIVLNNRWYTPFAMRQNLCRSLFTYQALVLQHVHIHSYKWQVDELEVYHGN